MARGSVFILISIVLLVGPDSPAFTQDVKYYTAPGTDFSNYKTYQWKRADDAQYPNELTDGVIVNAVDEQLAKKGLRKAEGKEADLFVVYQLAIVPDAEWSSLRTDIVRNVGPTSVIGSPGAVTNSSLKLEIGWMILDLYDAHGPNLIWQAIAKKTLGKRTDPKKMEKNARKAMKVVFSKSPNFFK